MADGEMQRPGVPFGLKVAVVVVIGIVAWIALRATFATVRLAFALAGYLIVAFVAYQFGKWVGRVSGPDDDS